MIEVLKEIGSTSAELLARLNGGERLSEGDWLVADRQTAGRGRFGRVWCDGAGNFMGSTVVHVGHGDPPAGSLALVAGVAVLETIARLLPPGSGLMLKWPNDLLVGPAKLSGILLEAARSAVVVGIGVNLVSAPQLSGRRTVALADLCEAPERDAFAADLARQFDLDLSRWRTYGLGPIINRWLAAAHPTGTALTVSGTESGELHGAFAGLSADGALQLRLEDGTTRTIHAGEANLAGN